MKYAFIGKGGIGKSTATKYLALGWADGTLKEMEKFQFVFHIALKLVKQNIPIEDIIIAQHRALEANNVQPAEIKSILDDHKDGKLLLLIDGYDEYKKGINEDIDKAINRKKLWNRWLILTSRETPEMKQIASDMDAEAEIHGFDATNRDKYMEKVLGKEKTSELLTQLKECDIPQDRKSKYAGDILSIPIILSMVCTLFVCNSTMPKTLTGIMQAIVDRCMDREAIRRKGQKKFNTLSSIVGLERTRIKLGKLAWHGLNKPGKKLLFNKVNLSIFNCKLIPLHECIHMIRNI